MNANGVQFAKMQGTGNDFLVLDNRSYQFSVEELSACAATWCERRYGVGADGLLALDRPETSAADYRMHYVNADGSRATMCGNGARCLFRFARQVGFEEAELAFDTDAGLYRATHADGEDRQVRLFVPAVTDVRPGIVLDRPVPERVDRLFYAHAGTEHLVAVVEDVESVPVPDWGARLRHDPTLQPAGANVNFVEVGEDGCVSLRTYEKGVEGETLSCGTGVLAAAVVAERLAGDRPEQALSVETKGGRLQVGIAETDRGAERYLEGPAEPVFRGTVPRPNLEESQI
jgi:diaminopimelate epimerase